MTTQDAAAPAGTPHLLFHQTNDAAGAQAARTWQVPVTIPTLTAAAVAVLRQLQPLAPRLTEREGEGDYFYLESDVGAGWVRVEGLGAHDLAQLHQLLTVEDFGAATGTRSPGGRTRRASGSARPAPATRGSSSSGVRRWRCSVATVRCSSS